MTDDITARARAALEGVTPGPWEAVPDEGDEFDVPVLGGDREFLCVSPDDGVRGGHSAPDARFIAAARSLVPELLAEVERLRGALDGLADELQAHVHTTPSDDDHEIICDVEETIACRIRDVLGGER